MGRSPPFAGARLSEEAAPLDHVRRLAVEAGVTVHGEGNQGTILMGLNAALEWALHTRALQRV